MLEEEGNPSPAVVDERPLLLLCSIVAKTDDDYMIAPNENKFKRSNRSATNQGAGVFTNMDHSQHHSPRGWSMRYEMVITTLGFGGSTRPSFLLGAW